MTKKLVIFLTAVAISIACVLYFYNSKQQSYYQRRAKESILRENLVRLREVLDQYYSDKGKYPTSLDVLCKEGYLRKIPIDPITGDDDWITSQREWPHAPNSLSGIFDILSSASGETLDGISYSDL